MAQTKKNSITNTLIPKALIPKALIPKALVPKALIPKAHIPKAHIPDAHSSDARVPDSHIPDLHIRGAPAANRHSPDSHSRERHVTCPGTVNPDTAHLDITHPDITPNVTKPLAAHLDSQRPNAPNPDVASGSEHRHFASLRPEAQTVDARAPGHHVARAQPALAALVRYHTREFGAPIMELALSCADLIVCATSDPSRPCSALRRGTVRQVFAQTTRVLFNLDCVEPALADRALSATQSKHPELLQSIEERLLGFEHAGKPLGNLELGVVYALARTALTVMERSVLATRQAHSGNATPLAARPARPPASTP